VPRRDPREARALGLWTAGWLFGLLLAGLLWIGDLPVQWPVLLVPVLWALVALRPRGGRARRDRYDDGYVDGYGEHGYGDHGYGDRRYGADRYDDDLAGWPPQDGIPPRTPPTRELPWLPDVPRDRRRE
jgi:hypothetical protein